MVYTYELQVEFHDGGTLISYLQNLPGPARFPPRIHD